ncbi:MAG: hypothetical protein KDC98_13720 [Planctomycetes bacterium]|nr:hypothetical protein [Planctomycetota bacterium]
MARRPVLMRLALLGGALIASLLAAEVLFRCCGPAQGGFKGAGTFYTPTGVEIPVAEIANFLSGGGYMSDSDMEHPYGRLTPGLEVKLGYDRPQWDYFDAQDCVLVKHNSRGYRDDEFPVQKPVGEFRVLAFGDSFTYGQGVRAEDAWPNLLELELRKHGPAQVVNCGFACGCYTPRGYDDWMQSDGLLLSPDLVIVGLCLNDMEAKANDVPMLSYPVEKPEHYPSALLEYAVATYKWRMARRKVTDFTAVVKRDPSGWLATQDGLRNLKAICDRAGIGLVVAVFPMLSQLDCDPYPFAGLMAMAVDFCREAGIACVDLGPDFIGRDDEMDLWVHPTDQHPNHVAHRMMCDRIHAFLGEQKLLPR